MKAFLILEDGTVFEGKSIGKAKEVISEIVCNTSMTGYLEILTDPSYAGQAVTMTYPLIGNYGICYQDMESKQVWLDAFIVRELSRMPSNFRSEDTIQHFLEENEIPGICGIDTRALAMLLRDKGSMKGMITTDENYNVDEVISKIKEHKASDVVKRVSCKEIEHYVPGDLNSVKTETTKKIAVIDVGYKRTILRWLLNRGCDVTVYPCTVTAEEILAAKPDGIMITNGPGDPSECTELIEQVKILADSGIPMVATCLGHQIVALSQGAKTYKMKYGHRGVNYPVKDLMTGKVYISSQNHGYVVDADSLDSEVVNPWFVNVNDNTIAGLVYLKKPIKTVQFLPGDSLGSKDSELLFDEFMKMIGGNK